MFLWKTVKKTFNKDLHLKNNSSFHKEKLYIFGDIY